MTGGEIVVEIGESVEPSIKPYGIGDLVNDQYEVIKEIGEGGFGIVLEVLDIKTNERLAMKVELHEPKEGEPGLHLEAAVLRRLQGYSHILKYYDEDTYENANYIVMQLAGETLANLRKLCPNKRFTTSTTARTAIQTLEAIENIHVAGLLHRDIKPSNFAIGLGDGLKCIVYILDFGLVRRYRNADAKIRQQRSCTGFRGSIRYASINAHKNVDLGRHDDLWSWLYTIVELRVGQLPWYNQIGRKSVGEIKMKTTKDELLTDMQPEYKTIYANLEKLNYYSSPPYSMYRDLLSKMIKNKNYSLSAPFDWELSGLYEDTKNSDVINLNSIPAKTSNKDNRA